MEIDFLQCFKIAIESLQMRLLDGGHSVDEVIKLPFEQNLPNKLALIFFPVKKN